MKRELKGDAIEQNGVEHNDLGEPGAKRVKLESAKPATTEQTPATVDKAEGNSEPVKASPSVEGSVRVDSRDKVKGIAKVKAESVVSRYRYCISLTNLN